MTVMIPRRNVPAILAVFAGTMAAAVAIRQRQQTLYRPALPPPQPQWLTLDQAARYTGLSEMFFRRLIAAGRLHPIDDGGLKVRRVDLDLLQGAGMNLAAAVGGLRNEVRKRRVQ